MILSFFYFLSTLLLDNNRNLIKLPEPYFESIRVLNYITWSSLAMYTLIFDLDFIYTIDFISKSMILSYIYEILYYTPDMAHSAHHIITISTQLMGYITGGIYIKQYAKIIILTYIALNTSILSSMRSIVKHNYKFYFENIKIIYMYNYIFFKIGAIIMHYYIIYIDFDKPISNPIIINLFLFSIIHMIQLYFVKKILVKLIYF